MNHFPRALYKAPGTEQLESGLFTTRLANDEAEQEAALADGWYLTQEDALSAYKESLTGSVGEAIEPERIAAKLDTEDKRPVDDDSKPATRAELEQQATALGIEFSPRIGDEKLAERIAAKLAEQGA